MTNIEIQVVNRIAQLRKAKSLTVTELACRANLSPSLISRIENYKVSPPLATIAQIAEALGASMQDLFKGEEESLSILFHRRDDKYETVQKNGKTFLIPFYNNIYRLMEPVIFSVPSGLKPTPKMHHEGEEYMYILEGSINFVYGRDMYVLSQHESVYFKGMVPHATYNEFDCDAKVLGITTSKQNLYNGVMFYRFLKDYRDSE